MVAGASVEQQVLGAGLVDELRLDVTPRRLDGGGQLLERRDAERVRLEKLQIDEIGLRPRLGSRIVN